MALYIIELPVTDQIPASNVLNAVQRWLMCQFPHHRYRRQQRTPTLGANLSQLNDNNEEHPIVFGSRKLQPREFKLTTIEKECLAIVWAVETFRYYLFGRKFKLQTDHNPLVWLNQVKDKNRKLLRWSLTLQEYEMEYEYKAGAKNVDADALSRIE